MNPWSFARPHYISWEETAFENGRISDFRGLVTLTLDRVILHTVSFIAHMLLLAATSVFGLMRRYCVLNSVI